MTAETFEPLSSTHIQQLDYDDESEDLTVTFNNGDQWLHRNVPPHEYRAFCSAPSAGKHYYRRIQNRFPGSAA